MLNQLTNEAWQLYKKILKIKFEDNFPAARIDKQQKVEILAYVRYSRRMYAWKRATNAYNRPYSQFNSKKGMVEWFFNGRGAEGVYGPFLRKEAATKALEDFIRFNIEFSCDGGRSLLNVSSKPPKTYRPKPSRISTRLSI